MKRAATVALALGAVIGAGLSPATAQVVIGGSGEPDVQVNLSVLDRLGPVPTLADMLKADIPNFSGRSGLSPSGAKREAITFRPYAPPKKAVVKKAVVAKAEAPKPSPAMVEPAEAVEAPAAVSKPAEPKPVAVAKSEPKPTIPPKPEIAEVAVPAKPEAVAVAKPEAVAVAKPEAVVAKAAEPAGPKLSLPQTPVPAAAKAEPAKAEPTNLVPAKPVAPAKTEIAKASEPVPAPKAETAVVPAPPAPAPQVAAVTQPAPQPAVSTDSDTMSILFSGDATRLPDISRGDLQKLAARMEKDEGLGLQLLAYADGDAANASRARRLSLSRALEVRKFLMEQGVRSTRIEVRALGNKSDGGGPADRVDAILVVR